MANPLRVSVFFVILHIITENTHMATINQEIERRRTFAIISHPDAGKTTLTEKLLLFGGAIHLGHGLQLWRL